MELYPLRFNPIFQTYLWGGRRLGTELNKPIGDEPTYAESWEIVDHGSHQSIVSSGPLAGTTLGDLVRDRGTELLGADCLRWIQDPALPANLANRFPLLFKFLDAKKNLSVQVHPNNEMAATLTPPDLGKTEAWYVLDAAPGSKVYAGLQPDVTPDILRAAIEDNTAESVLHSVEPQAGDCLFIPAGTVHAIGEGLLIAEIQQCSNTTFRLYDWGRVDKDGLPRELHIEQGLAATDFEIGPVNFQQPTALDEVTESIVDCDKFLLNRVRPQSRLRMNTDGSFKLLVVTQGSITLDDDPASSALHRGDTCLIPACLNTFDLTGSDNPEFLCISPNHE